ncbi:MAG: hypothetical protein LBM38_01870 [Clostridiales bacterium]|jgi:hypothetical protein|nr:hypothetical protein [Clostridiales bacterium]
MYDKNELNELNELAKKILPEVEKRALKFIDENMPEHKKWYKNRYAIMKFNKDYEIAYDDIDKHVSIKTEDFRVYLILHPEKGIETAARENDLEEFKELLNDVLNNIDNISFDKIIASPKKGLYRKLVASSDIAEGYDRAKDLIEYQEYTERINKITLKYESERKLSEDRLKRPFQPKAKQPILLHSNSFMERVHIFPKDLATKKSVREEISKKKNETKNGTKNWSDKAKSHQRAVAKASLKKAQQMKKVGKGK